MRKCLAVPCLALLFQLQLISTATAAPAVVGPDGPAEFYILSGQSTDFWCRHDAAIDTSAAQDLAVSVQDCSKTLDIVLQASDVSALATVIGKVTSTLSSYSSVFAFAQSDTFPLFRVNKNHPLIRDGSVSILNGNSSAIAVTIWDRPDTESMCVYCGQIGRTLNYVTTDKRRIRVVSRPEARLSLNNSELPTGYQKEVRAGDSFLVGCTGSGGGGGGGGGRLTTRLEKSGIIVAQSLENSVSHAVANASVSDSGVYQCYATSDLPHLVSYGQETGTASLTLRVSFAPTIEVDEAVRFTALGEKEDIQVKVSAYPEPHLSCRSANDDIVSSSDSPSSRLTVRETYSQHSFYAAYTVTFANLNDVANETLVTCSAENSLGRREVEIRLTALAPTPTIVSGASTAWWNSYDLRWQHHVKANVDYYRIRVVSMGPDATVNKTEQRLESVKQTDDESRRLRTAKDLVFNLSPDTVHNISLQACNKHGCSKFSEHVQVHTARESDGAYNDPRNPVFAKPQFDEQPLDAARQASIVSISRLLTAVGIIYLVRRLQ